MLDISVICPVYNDQEGIRDTLEALLSLQYPSESHEILVIDNGSTDRTRQVAERLLRDAGHGSVLVEDDIQSSYAARNTGTEHATGEVLAFIDADMTVDPTWLNEVSDFMTRSDAEYVGCNVEVCLPDDRQSLAGYYNVALGFPVGFYLETMDFAPTCCLVVRRSVLEDVGCFRDDLVSGGDTEFGRRVADAGYRQAFASEIVMYHPARTRFRDHVLKSLRLGRGRQQRFQNENFPGMGRPWFHPRNVLPRHPLQFRRRLQTQCSLPILVAFYLISYALKIFETIGQVEEVLSSESLHKWGDTDG